MTGSHGTQKDYAVHRGVTKQNVTHWKNKGLIKFSGKGVVDFDATDRRLQEHGIGRSDFTDLTDQPRHLADLPLKDGFWSKTDAETVKENYAARLKQLEFDREAAKVVEIDDVAVAVASEYEVVRNRAREIGARVAPKLAELTSAEEIKAAIDAAVIEALADLSAIVGGETDFDKLRVEAGFDR